MKVKNNELVPQNEKDIKRLVSYERPLDRVEKLELFYLEGIEITEEDERMRMIYLQSWEWLVKYMGDKSKVAKKMKAKWNYTPNHCFTVLRQAEELHGRIERKNKKATLEIYKKKYLKLAQKCEDEFDNNPEETKLLMAAEKFLSKALEIELMADDDKTEIPVLPDFEFTSDIDALKEEQEIEDAEYEMLD